MANRKIEGLKEGWDQTLSKANQLIEDTKTRVATLSPKAEPNLFTDMESGKLDRYMDPAYVARRNAKRGHTQHIHEVTDVAEPGSPNEKTP